MNVKYFLIYKILFFNIGWWSVTPEIIAEYTAELAKGCSVIDGFCGSGGNVIQFSKYCSEVFAIDIDPKKIEICKNNCKIYNCEDNIHFIECDFLKIEEYKPIKVLADYIFLSPPWGGIQYKNSDIYSIKALMKPDIFDIVKVSLRITKYIMFYVPRTLILDELFDIVSKIKGTNRIFFDVHILRSANKIKALLIIFGYNIDKHINESEIDDYLKFTYSSFNIADKYIKLLSAIAKIIGNFRFFENESFFRKSLENKEKYKENNNYIINFNSDVINVDDMGKELYNFFFKSVLTEKEKLKLKSLNLFKENKNNKNNINYSNVNINGNSNSKPNNNNLNKNNNNNITINNNDNKIINNSFFNTSIVSNINSTTIKPSINNINKKNGKNSNLIHCNQINLDYLKK